MTAVFDRNDKDGDGKLSKGEFKEMMMREKGKEVAKEKNKDNKEKTTWEQKILGKFVRGLVRNLMLTPESVLLA